MLICHCVFWGFEFFQFELFPLYTKLKVVKGSFRIIPKNNVLLCLVPKYVHCTTCAKTTNQPAKSYYLGIIVKMRTSTWRRRLRFRSIQIHPTMFFQKKKIHSLKMPSKKDKILYHYQILTTCFSILGYMKLTIHNKKQKILKKVQKYFFIFPLIDYCCIVHS